MRQIVHIEIPSKDDAEAKAFYNSLLGWQATEVPMGPDFTYVMFDLGNNMGTALSPVSEADNIGPGDVMLYFHSDDLDADMARVGELGGEVVLSRQEVPGFGAMGIFKDPTGNRVAFWQSVNPEQD